MPTARVALACLPIPDSPAQSLRLATAAVAEAGQRGALVACFPECYVPGYRWPGTDWARVPPDAAFLKEAHAAVGEAAGAAGGAVVLGTERLTDDGLQITALVYGPEGRLLGRQDKVQLDPSEEDIYPARGRERPVFTVGPLTFGIAICHRDRMGCRGPAREPATPRPSALPPARAHTSSPTPSSTAPPRQLPPHRVRRSRQHLPREGHALQGRRVHLLRRVGQLRFGGRARRLGDRLSRWHSTRLAALRQNGPAGGRSGAETCAESSGAGFGRDRLRPSQTELQFDICQNVIPRLPSPPCPRPPISNASRAS